MHHISSYCCIHSSREWHALADVDMRILSRTRSCGLSGWCCHITPMPGRVPNHAYRLLVHMNALTTTATLSAAANNRIHFAAGDDYVQMPMPAHDDDALYNRCSDCCPYTFFYFRRYSFWDCFSLNIIWSRNSFKVQLLIFRYKILYPSYTWYILLYHYSYPIFLSICSDAIFS